MKHINKKLMGMGLFVLVFAFIITIIPTRVFAAVSSPTIGSIAPAFGIVNGGTSITITGTEFATGATVTVGGAAAISVVVASATQITAVTPAGTVGAKDVVVTNTDTGTITSTGGFTYVVAPTAVNLGTAADFAVFSNTGISNTGTSSITGDIGTGPGVTSTAITGFALSTPPTTFTTSSLVSGNVYAYDYNLPTPTKEQNASSSLTTAYNNALIPATTVLDAGSCVSGTCNLGGLTLAPGVYTFNGSGNVNITTNLTLSGSGSAVWIFQIPGNLNISSATSVILSGGAIPANIFWAVAGTTTLQTTSTFEGNILAGPGASTIAMQNGAILQGRALGQTNVSLIGNTIVSPSGSVVPGAPTIGTAIAGNGQAVVTFSAPSSNGGSIITGYTVTSIPSGGTDSNSGSTSLSHIITGLTNGLSYTFTVHATNVNGNSLESSATSPGVTPSVGIIIPAVGTAVATQATSVITYTLTTGSFDPTAGIVNSNWTLGGTNVADLGTISHVVLSIGNTTAMIAVTGTVVGGNNYTILPAQATFSTGFTTPGATVVTMSPVVVVQGGGDGGLLYYSSSTNPTASTTVISVPTTAPSLPNTGVVNSITNTLPVVILGCGNRAVGFSTTTGQSCVGNTTVPGLPTAGTAPTYDFGATSLVRGSSGATVMELQRFLNANLNLNLVIDGYLGPKTIAVVKQWQKNNGLAADGIVGVKTKLKMNAVIQ
jgi:hypothetical protein